MLQGKNFTFEYNDVRGVFLNEKFNFQKIIDEYRARGHEFLFQVFESSKCLEELSGISDILNAQHEEVILYLVYVYIQKLILSLEIFQILEFDENSDFELSE